MADQAQEIAALRARLDALAKIQTQEDFDEGARLHALKNAPWVNGPLAEAARNCPPYVYREFPKMIYHLDYEDACKAYDQACLMPGRGSDSAERDAAIQTALRWKDATTKVVHSEAEVEAFRGSWFETPKAAYDAKQAAINEKATQAAHRNWDDRHVSEAAKREIDAIEEASDDFVAEIPESKKRGPRQKVAATV